MTHEDLCAAAYAAYINALVTAATGTPGCFSPLAWEGLHPQVRVGYAQATLAVQKSTSGSPKREAHAAFASVTDQLPGPRHPWEQLPEVIKRAWAAFTDFVIKHGQLN